MNVTRDVLHAVRRDLHPPNQCLWAEEVAVPDLAHDDGEPRRVMDAAAIETKYSVARLVGFEVKVSRGDWLNDLSGAKAAPAVRATNQFYYVFGSDAIFEPHEVPSVAGIIVIRDGVAVQHRVAPVTEPMPGLMGYSVNAIVKRSLRIEASDFIGRVQAEAEEKGRRKGLSEARRRSPVTSRGKTRYDPGRYNLDDGEPLDLP